MTRPSILWFRNDLRLEDNPALAAAVARGAPVIPLFIWSPEEEGGWSAGAASRFWLHQSLRSLGKQLRAKRSQLVLRHGTALNELLEVIKFCRAGAVFWNRRYEPAVVARDETIEKSLRDRGLEVCSFWGNHLLDPAAILNQRGKPYRVFTPFWRALQSSVGSPEPLSAPGRLQPPPEWPDSSALDDFSLEPKVDWAGGIREAWEPGALGAQQRLNRFLQQSIKHYGTSRDLPGSAGVSRLSPHLHFGEISPRHVWNAIQLRERSQGRFTPGDNANRYLRQLGWREFAHSLLYHFPQTPNSPLRPEFENFPWEDRPRELEAWQKGQTGYPIVDAGMRELWTTGWMHNRVRMIVASFLVKDLLVHWVEGARWFWDTLVDADLANNTLGWQWTAGCGADAAPYFRIFNPVLQAERYDPKGEYVRRWVPEIASLSDRCLHQPWKASKDALKRAGVRLGENYPLPLVDHSRARKQALEALASLKENR